jgi:hypothetical protein
MDSLVRPSPEARTTSSQVSFVNVFNTALTFACRGLAQDGYPAIHTVLVADSRPRSGENAAMARVIAKLPFNDTTDSTTFADNYRCQATVSMLAIWQ